VKEHEQEFICDCPGLLRKVTDGNLTTAGRSNQHRRITCCGIWNVRDIHQQLIHTDQADDWSFRSCN